VKLLFKTPNIRNTLSYMSNVLEYRYLSDEFTDSINPMAYKHQFILIELSKGYDDYIIDDLMKVHFSLGNQLVNTTNIETMHYYYMSICLHDVFVFLSYNMDNTFVDSLPRILGFHKSDIISNHHIETILNSDRLCIPQYYRPKLTFQILNDMRYFSMDYMQLLNITELSIEELNQLYQLSVRIKAPIYIAKLLQQDFISILSNDDWAYKNMKYQFEPSTQPISCSFKLSELTTQANVIASKTSMSINISNVMNFTNKAKTAFPSILDNLRLTTMGSYCDTFITIPLSKLSQSYNKKLYNDYIYAIFDHLVHTDKNINSIFMNQGG